MKMQYALVQDERQEPQPGLIGKCLCCNNSVIARCGGIRTWHWSHKAKLVCDPWWENQTEWHRAWKEKFPKECQEIICYAENGEKHIADVKIDQGYVVEFQHSYIKPEERQARENFYKKMIWIVDGVRRSRDKHKFIDVWENSYQIHTELDVKKLRPYFEECALLRDWCDSKVPIFFDFGEDILWGVLPKNIKTGTYAFKLLRSDLITYLNPATQIGFEERLKNLEHFIQKERMVEVEQIPRHREVYRPLRRRSWRL